MTYGYIRVSSDKQTIENQHNDKAIIAFAENEQGGYEGVIHGKKSVLLEMIREVIDCLKEEKL